MSADSLALLNAPAALAKLPALAQSDSVFSTQVTAPQSVPPLSRRSSRSTARVAPTAMVATTQAMTVALFLLYIYLAAVSRDFANLLPVMA